MNTTWENAEVTKPESISKEVNALNDKTQSEKNSLCHVLELG